MQEKSLEGELGTVTRKPPVGVEQQIMNQLLLVAAEHHCNWIFQMKVISRGNRFTEMILYDRKLEVKVVNASDSC